MMTYAEIAAFVESLGLPCSYDHFEDGTDQAPPFVCYLYSYDDTYADNVNYTKGLRVAIELYTDYKDIAREVEIERKLATAGHSYYKESAYIDQERMWQTTYTIGVLVEDPPAPAQEG